MTLADTQALFFALLHGVDSATSPKLRLQGSGAGDAVRRVNLYRSLNQAKTAGEMQRFFPRTLKLLGDDTFRRAVRELLKEPATRRSHSGSAWDNLADAFPRFLRRTLDRWGRSDVADLAELERARDQVAQEVDVEPLRLESIAGLTAQDLGEATVTLVPALRIVRSSRDVFAVLQALASGAPAPPPCALAATLVVGRRGNAVFIARADDSEARALERARSGAPLAQVFDAFAGDPDPAARAYATLKAWFDDGRIASIEPLSPRPSPPRG